MELYTDKDMVSFGNYLLSKERRESIEQNPQFEKISIHGRLGSVSHADFENWKEKFNKEKIS